MVTVLGILAVLLGVGLLVLAPRAARALAWRGSRRSPAAKGASTFLGFGEGPLSYWYRLATFVGAGVVFVVLGILAIVGLWDPKA